MKPTVHIELFAGCLRLFEAGKKFGDDYVFSCSLHWVNPEEVEMKAFSISNASLVSSRKVIWEELQKYGVKVVRWYRFKGGVKRTIRVNILTNKLIKQGEQ